MDREDVYKIQNGQLLDLVRQRPALYLGERSLSALQSFLLGFGFACLVEGNRPISHLPEDFHDWVAYRLHFYESTSGYRSMILSHMPDESAALDRFFELLDEYRTRRARVVASVKGHRGEAAANSQREILGHTSELLPENFDLVVFTDDPGFFVTYEDEVTISSSKTRYFPTLGLLESHWGVPKDDISVLDWGSYQRWLDQESKFSLALAR